MKQHHLACIVNRLLAEIIHHLVIGMFYVSISCQMYYYEMVMVYPNQTRRGYKNVTNVMLMV